MNVLFVSSSHQGDKREMDLIINEATEGRVVDCIEENVGILWGLCYSNASDSRANIILLFLVSSLVADPCSLDVVPLLE